MKIQKKYIFLGGGVVRLGRGGGGGGGVQGRCNREVKFLWKFKKNILWGVGGCLSWGGEGVRVDVNEELKFL